MSEFPCSISYSLLSFALTSSHSCRYSSTQLQPAAVPSRSEYVPQAFDRSVAEQAVDSWATAVSSCRKVGRVLKPTAMRQRTTCALSIPQTKAGRGQAGMQRQCSLSSTVNYSLASSKTATEMSVHVACLSSSSEVLVAPAHRCRMPHYYTLMCLAESRQLGQQLTLSHRQVESIQH